MLRVPRSLETISGKRHVKKKVTSRSCMLDTPRVVGWGPSVSPRLPAQTAGARVTGA
jgi:hypothetical protein